MSMELGLWQLPQQRRRHQQRNAPQIQIHLSKLINMNCIFCLYICRNLCAQDWVPAVGGTTEEFDHYWDALPEEDKKVCVYISAVCNNLTGF